MSGAFNIDVEVGQADNNKGKIRIYCASLTETWKIDHNAQELIQFHSSLSNDPDIKKNKIGLGQCPKIDKISECEEFLSRLGCTSAVLRVKLFHDFLNIPKSVRDGLTYASHKPFGKSIREGYMQKHPRFVRRGGGKKWIRLTKDDRGGSLICYKDENKNTIISSMKIGASTEIQNLKNKGIPNAFVLKSGKRQWVLQASHNRDYQMWQNFLDNMLKEFGKKVAKVNPAAGGTGSGSGGPGGSAAAKVDPKSKGNANVGGGISGVNQNNNLNKLQKININLKIELESLTAQFDGMNDQLNKLKKNYDDNTGGNNVMQKKIELEFEKEKDGLVRDYEIQMENLRNQLQELDRKLLAKTALDPPKTGLAKLGLGFGLGGSDEDFESQIDAEKKILDNFTEDERSRIKFLHKHLHRHVHVHKHTHRHLHFHKDADDNDDNISLDDFEQVDKHTISHTITHSNTQFEIKGSFF